MNEETLIRKVDCSTTPLTCPYATVQVWSPLTYNLVFISSGLPWSQNIFIPVWKQFRPRMRTCDVCKLRVCPKSGNFGPNQQRKDNNTAGWGNSERACAKASSDHFQNIYAGPAGLYCTDVVSIYITEGKGLSWKLFIFLYLSQILTSPQWVASVQLYGLNLELHLNLSLSSIWQPLDWHQPI